MRFDITQLNSLDKDTYTKFEKYLLKTPAVQTINWPEWMRKMRDMLRSEQPCSCRSSQQVAFEADMVNYGLRPSDPDTSGKCPKRKGCA